MVFTRVSNGPNPACAESAGIVMYRACPNWGEGIHRYRKVSPVSCIEYVSRGPRFTHFFKTCEIREIHARYQGKKMEEYRITIPVKKRAIHYDTWYWGKTYPIFGGNRAPIPSAFIWTRVRARALELSPPLSVPAHLHAASQRRLNTCSTTDTRRARLLVGAGGIAIADWSVPPTHAHLGRHQREVASRGADQATGVAESVFPTLSSKTLPFITPGCRAWSRFPPNLGYVFPQMYFAVFCCILHVSEQSHVSVRIGEAIQIHAKKDGYIQKKIPM